MLRNGWLTLVILGNKRGIDVQLISNEQDQLWENLKGLLERETVEQSYESKLISKPQPVIIPTALVDLAHILLR
jgi:hypothetical protein